MTAVLASRARAEWIAAVDPAAVREACGISQRTIARALGVAGSTIGRWERGDKRPTGAPGAAYCRVIAGLIRHLEVTP